MVFCSFRWFQRIDTLRTELTQSEFHLQLSQRCVLTLETMGKCYELLSEPFNRRAKKREQKFSSHFYLKEIKWMMISMCALSTRQCTGNTLVQLMDEANQHKTIFAWNNWSPAQIEKQSKKHIFTLFLRSFLCSCHQTSHPCFVVFFFQRPRWICEKKQQHKKRRKKAAQKENNKSASVCGIAYIRYGINVVDVANY